MRAASCLSSGSGLHGSSALLLVFPAYQPRLSAIFPFLCFDSLAFPYRGLARILPRHPCESETLWLTLSFRATQRFITPVVFKVPSPASPQNTFFSGLFFNPSPLCVRLPMPPSSFSEGMPVGSSIPSFDDGSVMKLPFPPSFPLLHADDFPRVLRGRWLVGGYAFARNSQVSVLFFSFSSDLPSTLTVVPLCVP